MDIFDEVYLSCQMSVDLVPGPLSIQPPYMSIEHYDIECYRITDVVRTLTDLENVMITQTGNTDEGEDGWYQWRWRWLKDDRWIDFDVTLFEGEQSGCWGGSNMVAHCTFADLVRLWVHVKGRYPAVWLHDNQTALHTPHSFLAEYAMPTLRQALQDPDRSVRQRAQDERAVYISLGLQPNVA